jgi:hypothetical protein
MSNNLTTEAGLGYSQRQALINKLAHRFAELNGHQIEQNLDILDINDAQNPQIKTWVAMAEVAVAEVEREITLEFEGERNYKQDADIAAFSDLDEDTVNELMDI